MSAPVRPADGTLFQPDEEIQWWLRPSSGGSRRGYLARRFTRPVVALLVAGVATAVTFWVVLPMLSDVRSDVTAWLMPVLLVAGLVAAGAILLLVVGLLALLIPEPACPPPPRVVADLLYVITDRRVLVVRASRGSGRAYGPDDLAPTDQAPSTYRIEEVRPGVGNILVGVPGPGGWIPRMSLWGVPDPTEVVARLQSWAGRPDGQPAD
ncbi:hypothetical protein [Actinocatenispora rupis]|uniref:Uncharacterized protein n=1 Tax=Actinocatenispora rupis TaxID=519421 RepID=A0A8J3JDL7_9ACTN|nr:hypothetical protein [Actinocatenispora rupis]GID14532.1 hypothetical protein Aru02nite_54210 [Actinocatenispora rupis]